MSMNFDAQQFDSAFQPRRLGNWEVPKTFPEPRAFEKVKKFFNQDIANGCGHLREELKNRKKNPFCNYIGTYQLPKRITKETAEKLSRFPQDYSVLDDIVKDTKSSPPRYADRNARERFIDVVRKCVGEINDVKDQKKLVHTKAIGKHTDESPKALRQKVEELERKQKVLRAMLQRSVNEGHEVDDLANNMKEEVEQFMREKDAKEMELVGKRLREKKSKLKKDIEGKERKMRKVVRQCVKDTVEKEIPTKQETDTRTMRQKITDCVNKTVDRERKNNLEEAFRESVRKCIENMKSETEQIIASNEEVFKDKVEKCVEAENENENEKRNVNRFKKAAETLKKNKAKNKEETAAFEETVQKCVEENREEIKTLNKLKFREKVKKCVERKQKDENKFSKVVRDCIPHNI